MTRIISDIEKQAFLAQNCRAPLPAMPRRRKGRLSAAGIVLSIEAGTPPGRALPGSRFRRKGKMEWHV
ncbi:hypothetical protein [Sphingopyxis sp.]|uniref:hypothetical protein n=1 Tax=Sphingopyxis sp. TaxID=1908224 RepID=UPI003BA8CFED